MPRFAVLARTIAVALAALCALAVAPVSSQAAISAVGQTTAETGAGASTVTVAKPTGTLPGDVMLLRIATTDPTAVPVPAGWTQDVTFGPYFRVFYRVAGLAEPSSYTLGLGVIRRATVELAGWRGVDTAQPIDASVQSAVSSGSFAAAPSVTTTRYGDAVVVGVAWGDGGVTSTAPAGVTSLGVVRTSGSTSGGITSHRGYFMQASPGATPVKWFTSSAGVSWGTTTVALREALPPAPNIDAAPATPGNSRSPAWSFSSAQAGDTFECRLDRGVTQISAWAACASPRTYDLTGQVDGDYTISVRAVSAAGNVGPTSTSTYTLDTAAPAAPSISSSPASPAANRNPSWSFSGEAGARFECQLDRFGTIVSAWASCTSAKTYDLSLGADGAYTFSVRAIDLAGNTSGVATSGYTLDTAAPAAPVIAGPVSPGNGRSPSWSFTAEAGAATQCQLDRGGTVVSAWASCTSPDAYDLTGQPDGTYTFSVRATDAAGNTGATATSDYLLDTAAPAAPSITASPTSPGSGRNPSWSFSGEAGASFQCHVDRAGTVVSAWASCAGTKSFSLSGQPDGTYTFSVRAIDAAGNTGATTTSDYVLDTTAPAAPSISVSPTSPGSGRNPSWSFAGEGGATLQCQLDRAGTIVSAWGSCAATQSYDLSLETDGIYTFSVRATDAAGNTGATATSTYTLDTTAPAVPVITASPTSPGSGRGPTWSFTAEAGATLQCRVDRGTTAVAGWVSCTSPKSFDLTGQPDGTYTFSVRATDAAGNTGTAATSDYVLDTTAPAAPSFTSSPSSPASGRGPSWSFSGEAGASLQCQVDRGGIVVSAWAACASPRSVDLAGQQDGTYTLSVRATDAAGNTGTAATSSYVLDTAAPAAPSISSSPSSPGAGRSPSWSFSGEAGATLECQLDRSGTVISAWASCAATKSYDLSLEPEGVYTFSVRATDAAGNTGAAAIDSYTLDTTAPAAPVITVWPTSPGNGRGPTWSFTAEAGATLQCRLDRGTTAIAGWASCTSPKSFDLTGQADGTYTISVRATDQAGNTGAATTSDYTLDTAAPAAPGITAAPPSPGNDLAPSWSFSGEAGASLQCRLDRGATTVSNWSSCAASQSYDLSLQPDGTYTFSVRATDSAGNTGATATSDYTLSTTRPPAPSIDVVALSPGRSATPSWSFSVSEAGDTFECRLLDGGTIIANWAACASPKSFDLAALPDATYTFAVRARTLSGTTGPETTAAYRYDTTAPAAPSIGAAPTSPGRGTSPSWSFSAETGATFECRLTRGSTTVSGWTGCTSARAYDLSAQPDGTYTFAVRATDQAGNTGVPATSDYALDATAPAAPAITSTPGALGRSRSPAWTFSGEAGATFNCRLARGTTVVSDWSSCAALRSFDLTGQPDGGYTFSVRATDAVGNMGATSTSDYTLDTTAPAAPSIDASPGDAAANVTPSWSFTGEAGASFECRLDGGSRTATWTPCPSPSGYDLTGQPDGTYVFSVRATDLAGNVGPATSAGYLLVTSQPTAPVIDTAPPVTGNVLAPTWSVSPSAPGDVAECRLDRGDAVVADWSPCSGAQGYNLAGQPDGTYTFSVRSRNVVGTLGVASVSTYVLDTTPPAAPTIQAGAGPLGRRRDPAWRFSGEAGSGFECRLARGATVVSDWAPCTTGRSYNLTGQPDGVFDFTVRSRDAAGNISASRADSYELDSTPPDAPDLDDGPGRQGQDSTPKWSFSGEREATYECRLQRGDDRAAGWTACTSPQDYDLTDDPDADYTFSVRATDAAGNTSPVLTSTYRLVRASNSGGNAGNADSPSSDGPGAPGDATPPSTAAKGAADKPATSASPSRRGGGRDDAKSGPARRAAAPMGGAARRGDPAPGRDGGRAGVATQPSGGAEKRAHPRHEGVHAAVKAIADVAKDVKKAAVVVAKNADKSVFPGSLLFIVVGFLSIQGRMDRNDPKLALAPAFADPDLDFGPPPTRE